MQEDEIVTADRASFRDLLRRKRAARSLTQEALAKRMGVSRALVNFLENGGRTPTRDFVSHAVRALDLPESDAALLWKAAGFIPPGAPIPFNPLATRTDLEQALPISDQNPILAYLAHTDVLSVVEGWRLLAEADIAIHNGQFDQARDLCAEVAVRRHATPALRLFARRKLAEANRQLGDLGGAENAIALETIAADLPENDNSRRTSFLRALLMAQRGEVALRRGQYHDGLNDFEASQEGYAALLESSSSETSAVIHLGLGMAFERMAKASLFLGDEKQAAAYCTAAELHLKNAAPGPQRSLLFRKVVELRAWALAREGKFESAIILHEQARDDAEKAGDIRGVLKNCVYLGDDWRRRVEKVIEDLCRDTLGGYRAMPPALAYAAAQRATDSQVDVWVSNAGDAYERARQLMETHPDPYMMGLCLRNLGIIACFQGKFADADALLRRAERFDDDMKLKGRLPAIYEARGDLYWGQGMLDLAVKWYSSALAALDELIPAADESDESSERSPSPDKTRETRIHAHERIRVLTSLEALLPLPAARQALERWRPDIDDILDKQWHEATAALKQHIFTVIHQGRGERVATSDSDLKWIIELATFEDIAGPRILAQNSLSAGWADALPDKSARQSCTEAELNAANDAFQRRRARINERAAAGYRDLAAKEAVLGGLATSDDRSRARNALVSMEQSHGDYKLTLSRFSLPIAFTVKGDRVLAEVPGDLLKPIQPIETLLQDTLNSTQPMDEDAIWCYRFDDANLAQDLTSIFSRLEAIAVKQGGDNAEMVLRRHLSTIREHTPSSGV